MIKGVGIDAVTISEIEQLCDDHPSGNPLDDPFVTYTFTDAERTLLQNYPRPFEALAGMYAVKEAVFKAVAHLTPERTFEFRIVEVLHREDGYPYVNITDELRTILNKAQVQDLQVSIANEGDTAIAIALAQ